MPLGLVMTCSVLTKGTATNIPLPLVWASKSWRAHQGFGESRLCHLNYTWQHSHPLPQTYHFQKWPPPRANWHWGQKSPSFAAIRTGHDKTGAICGEQCCCQKTNRICAGSPSVRAQSVIGGGRTGRKFSTETSALTVNAARYRRSIHCQSYKSRCLRSSSGKQQRNTMSTPWNNLRGHYMQLVLLLSANYQHQNCFC